MKTAIKIITLIAIGLLSVESMGQSQEKIYSALILNFARGIQWPVLKPTEDFVVGVYGYEPLADELLAQVDKIKVGNKKIVVREYSSTDEVKDCQILFIPAYKGRLLQAILDKIGEQAILLITNKTDSALKWSQPCARGRKIALRNQLSFNRTSRNENICECQRHGDCCSIELLLR
jgi:hypothetical protein